MTEVKGYTYHRVFDGYNFLSASGAMEEIVGTDMELVSKADHDAALRRAKAEVLREVKYEALGSRIKCFKSDTLYAEGNDDALKALVKWIDARAAQIEEGE